MPEEHGEQCPSCERDTLVRVKQAWQCPSCGFYDGCCEGEPLSAGNFEVAFNESQEQMRKEHEAEAYEWWKSQQ